MNLKKSLYDPANWPDPPAAADIEAARTRAGLTREEAGALIWTSGHAWRKWESDSDAMARAMHPGLWELWVYKVALLRGWPQTWATQRGPRAVRYTPPKG